jgi:dienelactone hydrolase
MRLKALHCFRYSLSASIIMLSAANILSAAETQADNENPGNGWYMVGFKTIEIYDFSRTVRAKYDYFGNPIDRETARPIQICLWYPAIVPEDDLPMVVSEYNFPYPEDEQFVDFISEIQNREIALLQGLVSAPDSVFEILNNETGAYKDAPFADGDFPLIIYSLDAGHGITENYGLLEFLASRGYVVATVHSVGTFLRDPYSGPMDLETSTRDLEFALSSLKEYPHIDNNKMGVMGCGFGAFAALLLRMRNYDIDAIACLFDDPYGNDRVESLKSNPFYNPDRVNGPLLQITSSADTEIFPELTDSMVYSTRYIISFKSDSGVCLSNYDKYRAVRNSPSGELSQNNVDSYDALCSYTASFFDASLKSDARAETFWAADPATNSTKPDILGLRYIPAKMAPPTEAQFMHIINNQGIDTAVELYSKFRPEYPDHIFFREAAFNFTGYGLLQTGRIQEALRVFELNADAFPNSANVWDSYGEACLAAGDYGKALENYKKALETLPRDTTSSEGLKTAIQDGAPRQIQRIEELMSQTEEEENQ